LSQGSDGVRTWDVATGRLLHAFPKETSKSAGAPLSPDGKRFLTASSTGIHLWDIASGKLVRIVARGEYISVRLSPDGKRIAAFRNGFPRLVEVLEADTGQSVWLRDPAQAPMVEIAFTADSKSLIVAGWAMNTAPPAKDHRVLILDTRTGAELRCMDTGTL